MPPHIVILGAGFAGTSAARELGRLLPAPRCRITLVDRHNFLVFTPLLTELAGGEVDGEDVVVPIRSISPRIEFLQGDVIRLDTERRQVTVDLSSGSPHPAPTRTLEADHLVVALGSETNFHDIPGLQQHALTIKSIGDAGRIRSRVLRALERANASAETKPQEPLGVVVGGGGFSGVETAAAVNDLIQYSLPRYPNLRRDQVRTFVVHPGERLLPELSEDLAGYAQSALERHGVRIALDTKITGASAESVEVDPPVDGQKDIACDLLIWAGGVRPNPVIEESGAQLGKHHGMVTDECMRAADRPGVWALGDCAEIPMPGGHKTYSPTAQNATREGKAVAANIVRSLDGQSPQPFRYTPIGELAMVGKRAGVASVYGFHLSGAPAWAMWRAVYLGKMPSTGGRVRVAASWLLDLAFGREAVDLP